MEKLDSGWTPLVEKLVAVFGEYVCRFVASDVGARLRSTVGIGANAYIELQK